MVNLTNESVHHFVSDYEGSQKLNFLANATGSPVDQINFVVCQVFALSLSYFFRLYMSPRDTSVAVRHGFSLVVGLCIAYFCFGNQIIHLVALPSICYAILVFCSPNRSHLYTLVAAIAYLSAMHLERQTRDYGAYTLDVTGPIMICVQKLTSLAFSYHDGVTRNKSDLTPTQKTRFIRKLPTPLEYYSFTLNFQGILAGPLVFYSDYKQFIVGTNYTHHKIHKNGDESGYNNNDYSKIHLPNPTKAVVLKVFLAFMFAAGAVTIYPHFPVQYVKDATFLKQSFMSKTIYMIFLTSITRWKYYHAWYMADAVYNAAGLGFNGYKDGEAQWDLCSNVHAWKIETGVNLRESLDGWNMGTMKWLREICYERTPYMKTALTYTLSAIWHGFYPGYYLTFFAGILFTTAARAVRKAVRPHVVDGIWSKRIYDVITILTTRVVFAYVTISFIILELESSFKLFWSVYFYGHILGLAAIILMPVFTSVIKKSKQMSRHHRE